MSCVDETVDVMFSLTVDVMLGIIVDVMCRWNPKTHSQMQCNMTPSMRSKLPESNSLPETHLNTICKLVCEGHRARHAAHLRFPPLLSYQLT